MRTIEADNAADYLRERGRVPGDRGVAVRELAGGVSNVVLRVDVEGGPTFVVKQSRERLRVAQEWRSRLDRIWTELEALRLLGGLLPAGSVPGVLFVEEDDYLFAMTCAPDDAAPWKARLMAGSAEPALAVIAGNMLGTIHRGARGRPELAGRLAETDLFDQLRVDPYYRRVAEVHPALAPRLSKLIDAMPAAPDTTLVLADFSPKNLLAHAGGLVAIDFETAHAGDPAFDLGFFLSHLLLKSFRAARPGGLGAAGPYLDLTRAFWSSYRDAAQPADPPGLTARATRHAAACALARLDGKSPVDYRDQLDRESVRRFAIGVLQGGPISDWEDIAARVVALTS